MMVESSTHNATPMNEAQMEVEDESCTYEVDPHALCISKKQEREDVKENKVMMETNAPHVPISQVMAKSERIKCSVGPIREHANLVKANTSGLGLLVGNNERLNCNGLDGSGIAECRGPEVRTATTVQDKAGRNGKGTNLNINIKATAGVGLNGVNMGSSKDYESAIAINNMKGSTRSKDAENKKNLIQLVKPLRVSDLDDEKSYGEER